MRETCRQVGIEFDAWQADLNRCILATDSIGWYAADTVVMSICRQAGKTFDIGALVFADSIKNPGTHTVWTAHRFTIARDTFNELRALAMRSELAPFVDQDEITTGAGNEAIPFRNGSKITFKARERASIRGSAKVRRIVMDEAQRVTEQMMADAAPTQNQAFNPQIILMGTPPSPTDAGEVFTELRRAALAGESEGVLYVEFSADADADWRDWSQVAKANPSFPSRTPHRAILRMWKLLTNDDDKRREGLGIWAFAGSKQVIPRLSWNDAADAPDDETGHPGSVAVGRLALGVEAGPDLAWCSVSLAGQRADGHWHIELDERREGWEWAIPWIVALGVANPQIRAVVADPASPTKAMFDAFKAAGVRLTLPKVAEVGTGCTHLLEGVVTGQVHHTGQAQLTAAVSVAGKRNLADTGVWVFHRASAAADITPVQAANLALIGAQSASVRRPFRSATSSRRAVVM